MSYYSPEFNATLVQGEEDDVFYDPDGSAIGPYSRARRGVLLSPRRQFGPTKKRLLYNMQGLSPDTPSPKSRPVFIWPLYGPRYSTRRPYSSVLDRIDEDRVLDRTYQSVPGLGNLDQSVGHRTYSEPWQYNMIPSPPSALVRPMRTMSFNPYDPLMSVADLEPTKHRYIEQTKDPEFLPTLDPERRRLLYSDAGAAKLSAASYLSDGGNLSVAYDDGRYSSPESVSSYYEPNSAERPYTDSVLREYLRAAARGSAGYRTPDRRPPWTYIPQSQRVPVLPTPKETKGYFGSGFYALLNQPFKGTSPHQSRTSQDDWGSQFSISNSFGSPRVIPAVAAGPSGAIIPRRTSVGSRASSAEWPSEFSISQSFDDSKKSVYLTRPPPGPVLISTPVAGPSQAVLQTSLRSHPSSVEWPSEFSISQSFDDSKDSVYLTRPPPRGQFMSTPREVPSPAMLGPRTVAPSTPVRVIPGPTAAYVQPPGSPPLIIQEAALVISPQLKRKKKKSVINFFKKAWMRRKPW